MNLKKENLIDTIVKVFSDHSEVSALPTDVQMDLMKK